MRQSVMESNFCSVPQGSSEDKTGHTSELSQSEARESPISYWSRALPSSPRSLITNYQPAFFLQTQNFESLGSPSWETSLTQSSRLHIWPYAVHRLPLPLGPMAGPPALPPHWPRDTQPWRTHILWLDTDSLVLGVDSWNDHSHFPGPSESQDVGLLRVVCSIWPSSFSLPTVLLHSLSSPRHSHNTQPPAPPWSEQSLGQNSSFLDSPHCRRWWIWCPRH